jgi:uncharacterized protein Smg (DUF494 family)
MHDSILEIIIHILMEMNMYKSLNEIDIKKLSIEGYTEAEIISAFSWIFSKINPGERILTDKNTGFKSTRFLNKFEKSIITPEAFGFLIELNESGMINGIQTEKILDTVFFAGYQKVTIEDIDLIVSSIITETDGIPNTQNSLLHLYGRVERNSETIH